MDDQLERPLKGLLSITTTDDYEMALSEIEELVDLDPMPETFFGRELIRLTSLVREYERRADV